MSHFRWPRAHHASQPTLEFDRRSLVRHEELIDVDLLKETDVTKSHPVLGEPLLRYQEQLRPDVLVCSHRAKLVSSLQCHHAKVGDLPFTNPVWAT